MILQIFFSNSNLSNVIITGSVKWQCTKYTKNSFMYFSLTADITYKLEINYLRSA